MARFRYGALFAVTLAMTVFALTASDGRAARTIELLAAGAALLVAVVTSSARRAIRRDAAILVGATVVAGAIASAFAAPAAAAAFAATAALAALTITVIARGLLRLILQRGVNVTAVFGALSVYLLVGLMFGFLIGAIATGFAGDYFSQGTDGTQSDRLYFSFTTLTTTGFGDFSARTRPGHSLAVLEMLTGQLYLVTVISLLVGNLRRRDPSPARGDAGSPTSEDALSQWTR